MFSYRRRILQGAIKQKCNLIPRYFFVYQYLLLAGQAPVYVCGHLSPTPVVAAYEKHCPKVRVSAYESFDCIESLDGIFYHEEPSRICFLGNLLMLMIAFISLITLCYSVNITSTVENVYLQLGGGGGGHYHEGKTCFQY